MHNLEQDGTAQFRFVQGKHRIDPPKTYVDYFGPPPHYTYIRDQDPDLERGDVTDHMTFGETPEETVEKSSMTLDPKVCMETIDSLNELLSSEGPFDAVLGFSFGACIASTLVYDNICKSRDKGVPSMFKMGIFFCGWPPINLQKGRPLLADTFGEIFEMPTIHVIGSADPLIDCALALYNLCDPETADIFDHGRGHQLIGYVLQNPHVLLDSLSAQSSGSEPISLPL